MHIFINGTQIEYEYHKLNAQAETILFLHGFGGSINSFKALNNKLKTKFNTINLTLPGFFSGNEVPQNFTIYDYASLISVLLQTLKVKQVNVISHSFGGRIALILANRQKKLIKKMVLINSAGLRPRFSLRRFLKIKIYKIIKFLTKIKLLKKSILSRFGSSDYKKVLNSQKKVFSSCVNAYLDNLLPKISAKTLILWGDRDKTTPVYMAKRLNKHIKNSKLIIYKDAGHYSYIDAYFEATQNIIAFLMEE